MFRSPCRVVLHRLTFSFVVIVYGFLACSSSVNAALWHVDATTWNGLPLESSAQTFGFKPTLTQGKGNGKANGLFKKKDRTTEEPASPPEQTTAPTESTTTSTSSTSLAFTAMEGGSNPSHQTLTLTNLEGGTLSWSASDNGSWLNLSPASGSTTNQTDTVTVAVDIAGLSSNNYTAMITLAIQSPTAATHQIPVTLSISPAAATIGHNPTSLTFAGTEGGANPTGQSIGISNTGSGTLNWSATKNANWLNINPLSGSITTGTSTITASVNANGLTANTYTAKITVTDPASSNSPREIPVTLAIIPPNSGTAQLSWDPSPSTDVVGYKVYVGTESRKYTSPIDVATAKTHKFAGLESGKTYYFSVTAYNKSGVESLYSTEVYKAMP